METNTSLAELKKHYPLEAKDERTTIISKMLELIREKTKNFTDESGLITEPVDLKTILEKEGIKPAEWQQAKGSIERTEIDTVGWLAKNITRIISPVGDAAKARIRKAKALMLKLQLMNLTF
jgi:hypothetical protein